MSLVINDTSYAGTFASYFILPATFGMNTIAKNAVYVQDNIRKQHTIGRLDTSNPLQPRQATPTGGSNFTIDGRVLNPQDIMAYWEFNPRDLESHWLAEQLNPQLLYRDLPFEAETYMMQQALNRAFEQVENGLWMGSTTYTAAPGTAGNGQICFFDGFIKLMVNDSAVLKVANPFTLTAAASDGSTVYNIVDAFNSLLALAATNKKALLSRPNRYDRLKFFVSINTEQIYETFLTTTLTFKGVNTTERGINKFKGYEIVPLAGMPDNTIVFTEGLAATDSNLWVGMNSGEDTLLQLAKKQANSEIYFLKGLMKYSVQYGFSEEVFLFTTLTSGTFTA